MLVIAIFGAAPVLLFHTPTKYGSDRFRKIFIDHWERWWGYRREEIPAGQRVYVQKTVKKMMGCRNPQCGYARYICPKCHEERIVPFSCKTRFCSSCGKVRTEKWVGRISQELLDVPHSHLTLTIAKEMRPCLHQLYPHDGRLHAVIRNLYQKRRGLQVYTDSFYPKGVQAASYIGRYMGHPPMAMPRLTHYDGQLVRFWYEETATGLRRDVTLSALDFISLIVKHIPPKGMQMMRHAGPYARNTKAKWAAKVRVACKAARELARRLAARPKDYRQLAFGFL